MSVLDYVASYGPLIGADLLVFVGGMLAGVLLNSIKNVFLFQNIIISPKHRDAEWNLARIRREGKKDLVYLNTKSPGQTLAAWWSFFWWSVTGRKHDYILQDKKKQRIICAWHMLFLITVLSIGLYFIFTIQTV